MRGQVRGAISSMIFASIFAVLLLFGYRDVASFEEPQTGAVPVVKPRLLAQFPHDTRAFTQGLAVADGALYEGTGWYGESNLRLVDLSSGTPFQQVMLPPDVFGEGITVVKDRVVQLTWRTHVGYVWDRATFTLLGTFNYPTEGWGLA